MVLQNLKVGDFVLPFHAKDHAQAAYIVFLFPTSCPGLCTIQRDAENTRMMHFRFCMQCQALAGQDSI